MYCDQSIAAIPSRAVHPRGSCGRREFRFGEVDGLQGTREEHKRLNVGERVRGSTPNNQAFARARDSAFTELLLDTHSIGGYCTRYAVSPLRVFSIVRCLSHVGCAALHGASQCLQGRVRSRAPHLPLSLAVITRWAHRAPWARSSAPLPPLMLADVGRMAPWSAWRGRRACCCWWRRSTPSSP